MANARAKAVHSKSKDLRQGITEQPAGTGSSRPRRKDAKPWTLEEFWPFGQKRQRAWWTRGRYRTREEAEKMRAKALREYAFLPPEHQYTKASTFRIVGPDDVADAPALAPAESLDRTRAAS